MKFSIVKVLSDYYIIQDEDIPVYEYGVFVLGFNVSCILVALLIGALFHQFIFISQFFLFFIPIRIFLGGFHFNSPYKCMTMFESLILILVSTYPVKEIVDLSIILWLLILFAYGDKIKSDHQFKNSKSKIVLFFFLLIDGLLWLMNFKTVVSYALLMNCLLYYMNKIKILEKIK